MFRLWVENDDNQKFELSNSPYFQDVEISGLLPTKARITTTVVANRDGSIINSARKEERDIGITITPAISVEENRQLLYQYFKLKKYVTIYFKNKNRDLKIKGMVENIDGDLFKNRQVIDIDIVCENPYFEELDKTNADMAQIEDLFEFPFFIEDEGIEFSRINQVIEKIITNSGEVETGVIIELTASGTVINPTIYNVDTREKFGLKFTMQYGDLIRIDTNSLNKVVELERYGEITNIINSINRGNNWFKLATGNNRFSYNSEQGNEFLNVKFIYSNLYDGV